MSDGSPGPVKPSQRQDRREFLKRSTVAVSAAALAGTPVVGRAAPVQESAPLDPVVLRAVAAVVLPTELGEEGREGAVRAFEAWAHAYEPVAELNHGYGTSLVRYGPPDPVPGWTAQLQALDLEASKRHDARFADLQPERARTLLGRQLDGAGPELPPPLSAGHVAVALMAHWFASTEAVDRCYETQIGMLTCRGLDGSADEPERTS